MSAVTGSRPPALCEVREVSKLFPVKAGLHAASGRKQYVRAVDRVSLVVAPGESVGLVGESGCGKSTLGRLMIRMETPSSGQVFFDGEETTRLRGGALRRKRREMQIIFQDPVSSLNPRFTVRETLAEAVGAHRGRISQRQESAHIAALLSMVGLPLSALDRLPREFSGGERQRISIARALAVEPRFMVADEPVSSLDPASQSQITNLLETLRRELGLAFLLITHNLELVRDTCSKVAVMYLGRLVEISSAAKLFSRPIHPYARALMAARLSCDPDARRRTRILPGDPPSPMDPPKGCHFHPRCPYTQMQCRLLVPPLREVEPGRFSRCHFDFDGGGALLPAPPVASPDRADG